MLTLWPLIIYGSASGAFKLIGLEGDNVTLPCTVSQSAYPKWSGPDQNGTVKVYTYDKDSKLSPNLGEKSNRLAWDPQNNKSLILQNVIKNDKGIYTCVYDNSSMKYDVLIRVMPQDPVIYNNETLDDTRIIVRGTEDQPAELTCTSNGGYPKPNLKWYRGNNQTQSLISHETSEINGGDGNYIVVQKYKFTPTRQDDRVSYLCQSLFDQPKPSYKSEQIILYLTLKPAAPSVTSPIVTEHVFSKVAECRTSQFRPKTIQVWLQKEGNNVSSEITFDVNHTTETYTMTASYSDTLTRESNGNSVVCHISHDAVQEPLKEFGNINVKFRPLEAMLVGATSNIVANGTNRILLGCIAGSSNPRPMIKWFMNNQEVNSTDVVNASQGEYNGIVTSQILELVPDRRMDGQEVHCTVHNSVNEHSPVQSTHSNIYLLYHPIITSVSAVKTIVEGHQTTFICEVDSKPSANVTWYRGTDVFQTERPTVKNIGKLVIPNVNRTHAGTYTCEASNGYMPNGTNETDLVVQYAPDVEVVSRNVTVNDSIAELHCKADGVPAIYTYSDWQHTWPGYGTINHTVKLGNNFTLTLASPTYEYSGEYTCTVSNGVSGSLKPYAGYGKAYLNIETYPIITTPSSKKVSAQLDINTSTIIHFYSNRNDNKVECYRGESNHECSYAIHTGTIDLPIFDSVIQTEGLAAKITFAIQHRDHFGNITVMISNYIGKASTDITVVPEGPPERPHSIVIWDISSTSVTISWIPGFHGGFDQTFLLQYSTTADTWDQYNNDTIHGGKNDGLLNANITGLHSGTRYFFRLLAYNSEGNSGYTDVYNFSTAFQGTKPPYSDITAIVAGSAATGAVAFIACSFVLVSSVVRYRRKKGGRKEQNRRSRSGNENIFDEDGMGINQAFVSVETMGIQPPCSADGASNIYAQVDKSKMQIMQVEDNTYAVVDKTKKRKNTLLGQKDIYAIPMKKRVKRKKRDKGNKSIGGDVYENVQELDCFRNIVQNDEDANLYHNGDENIPYKRNLNKDGLLYADLAFDNTNKGQKKMVIHGLENATDYVEIDFSKKAEPLPDSDEEA